MLRTFSLYTVSRFARFLRDYRYYRRQGLNSRAAWHLAGSTLP